MTNHNDVEIRLRQALEVPPTGRRRLLDARVTRAMRQPIAARGWRVGGSRSLLRPLVLAAALALVAGTVAATLTLLERIASESTPGMQMAWDNAELVALEETNAGGRSRSSAPMRTSTRSQCSSRSRDSRVSPRTPANPRRSSGPPSFAILPADQRRSGPGSAAGPRATSLACRRTFTRGRAPSHPRPACGSSRSPQSATTLATLSEANVQVDRPIPPATARHRAPWSRASGSSSSRSLRLQAPSCRPTRRQPRTTAIVTITELASARR